MFVSLSMLAWVVLTVMALVFGMPHDLTSEDGSSAVALGQKDYMSANVLKSYARCWDVAKWIFISSGIAGGALYRRDQRERPLTETPAAL
ncbi:MAG: hypothetical protein GX591_05710 [Planctomycetes bacterium]|nr:hypothetical protein [Planctomycetota bacterium]